MSNMRKLEAEYKKAERSGDQAKMEKAMDKIRIHIVNQCYKNIASLNKLKAEYKRLRMA